MSTFVFFSFMLNLASVMYRGDILDKGPCFRLVRCAAAGARRVYCVVGPPNACYQSAKSMLPADVAPRPEGKALLPLFDPGRLRWRGRFGLGPG